MRLAVLFFLIATLSGCSLPRVVVLNDPLDAGQHNDLGVAYEKRGEPDLAEREYRRAARLDREWDTPWYNMGNLYAGDGKWLQAEVFYREALERNPLSAEAMNNLAWAMLQAGRTDAALSRAQQAASLLPDSPVVLDTLAEVHLAREETTWAQAIVARALELNPENGVREKLEAKRLQLAERARSLVLQPDPSE